MIYKFNYSKFNYIKENLIIYQDKNEVFIIFFYLLITV